MKDLSSSSFLHQFPKIKWLFDWCRIENSRFNNILQIILETEIIDLLGVKIFFFVTERERIINWFQVEKQVKPIGWPILENIFKM